MKIFNWVHRKFSNYKENADNNKTNGGTISVIGDHDNHLWSGGILTIGTFGYDPLKDIHEENDRFLHEENDRFLHEEVVEYDQMNIASDDDSEEDEAAYENNEEEDEAFVFEACEHESEEGITMEGNNYKREFEYVMMEKKERITLADLFSADHDDDKHKRKSINNNNNNNNNNVNMKKSGMMTKEKANCKHGFSSFAKKLIVVEEARPIHKLNQMVRRMMRRKIHPDLLNPLNSKTPEVNYDNASLLPTQDAIV